MSTGSAQIASVLTIVALASLVVSVARPAHADPAADETRTVTILASEPLLPTNPLAPDAQPVGSATCISCHALENIQFAHTVHARAFRSGAQGASAEGACETCHGPGSSHATNSATPGTIISFTHGAATPIALQTSTCLGCHVGGARQHWLGSIHDTRGLSCSD